MKKVIALFLAVSILLLAGCSESSKPSSSSVAADELSLGFRTSDYEIYLNHMADYVRRGRSLSGSFIMADRLFVFGSWDSFSFEWDGPPEDSLNGQYYRYYLKAPGKVSPRGIVIFVHHQPEQSEFKDIVGMHPKSTLTQADYENSTSMARIPTREDSFRIERNGVTYSYIKGYLKRVLMEVNGILYVILVDDREKNTLFENDNSVDSSSTLGRLLSLDEDVAKEAYNEIKASLTK